MQTFNEICDRRPIMEHPIMIWSEAVNQSHASQKNERGGPKRNNTCCHGRQQNICQACGGRSICVHGRRRTRCVLCGGGNLCPHGRRHGRCKEAACANWSRPISKLRKGANEAKATCAQEETTSTKDQTPSATNMPHVQLAVPLLPQAVPNGALSSPAVFPWAERTTDVHDTHLASLMTAPAYFPQYGGSAEWTAQLQSYMQALPPFPHHHRDPSNGPLHHQLWLKHLEANIVQNQLQLHQMLLLMQPPLLPSSSYAGHPPVGAQHGFLERTPKISPPGFPSSSSQFVWDEQNLRGAGTAFRAFESVKPSKQPSYAVRYP